MKEDVFNTVHALSAKQALEALESSSNGLPSTKAEERLKQFGENSIEEQKGRSPWVIFFSQFKTPIVILLVLAAGLSLWFSEWIDAVAIAAVLLINSLIGFFMEFQAHKTMKELKKLVAVKAKVVRDETLKEIDSRKIVPGDIVYVEAGDLVPADGRILEMSQLQVDESPLTGESFPVEKQTGKIDEDNILAERTNMLYRGTFISKGNAYYVVSGTGMHTELGDVASLVESAGQSSTPLEKKLEQFTRKLILVTVGLVALIFLAGILYGQQLVEMVKTSIALAVAAIPEGLPIVATLALAKGMMRLVKHKVIVKKLSSVETLGGTSIICADKTGTLTKNNIEVKEVTGPDETVKKRIVEASILCNTASLNGENGKKSELGDPLEIGLLKYAEHAGADINGTRKAFQKVSEEPFSSETKLMSTQHKTEKGFITYSKGAVEEIVVRCNRIVHHNGITSFSESAKRAWLNEAEQMAAAGLRVIAAAFREDLSQQEKLTIDLVFLGLIGMIDPPREEVFDAIKQCRSAGIAIVMITGDHPATAQAIAAQLKLSEKPAVLSGKQMKPYNELASADKKKWFNTNVFARVSPKQKLDIVKLLQEKGHVVAMTGDGINDAPALKKSDIGVAMGLRGTQVAQEVSDMVLRDDSFSSIVVAIKQGRIIFENIRKFVVFLLSCNLSEIIVVSIAAIFNLHFQMFPLQILFINLITDVLPALALGVSAGEAGIMEKPPRNVDEPIVNKRTWKIIFVFAVIMGAVSIGSVFASHYFIYQGEEWNAERDNNILFFSLIFCQLLHVFNMHSGNSPFFKSDVVSNVYIWLSLVASVTFVLLVYFIPIFRNALSLHEMNASDWLIAIGASLVSLFFMQLLRMLKIVTW
ncbi:MAG TPA: cation-translocating P-type ATPase [Flavobacteriales bacterium]|nr:cation-translocating P-type ATPase [Flavobacteriales bacterium]